MNYGKQFKTSFLTGVVKSSGSILLGVSGIVFWIFGSSSVLGMKQIITDYNKYIAVYEKENKNNDTTWSDIKFYTKK